MSKRVKGKQNKSSVLDKEIKQITNNKDRFEYVEDLVSEAEEAARQDLRTLYKITKSLNGNV